MGACPRARPDPCGGTQPPGSTPHAERLVERVVADTASSDLDTWMLGSFGVFQAHGEVRTGQGWRRWNRAMRAWTERDRAVDAEHHEHGSWKPVGPRQRDLGRVYATAARCLCLQIYYRYPRIRRLP